MPIDLTDTQKLLATYSLPSRLRSAFDYAGCLTVGDVLQLTPDRLQHLPRSGVATLQKWLDVLDIGLTVVDLKQAKKLHMTFGEILGIATDNEAMTDLATLRLRRMSDEEIKREDSKFTWTYRSASAYEAYCTGARLARQWGIAQILGLPVGKWLYTFTRFCRFCRCHQLAPVGQVAENR